MDDSLRVVAHAIWLVAFLSITHRYLKPLKWWVSLCYLLPLVVGVLFMVQYSSYVSTNLHLRILVVGGEPYSVLPDLYWLVSLCLLVTMLEGFRIGQKRIAWGIFGFVMLACFMRFNRDLVSTLFQVISLEITSTKIYAHLSSLSKIIGYLPANLKSPGEGHPGLILTCDVPVKWSAHMTYAARHLMHVVNAAWLVLLYAVLRWFVLRPGRRRHAEQA